jgi:four helix bundle protein
LLFVELLFVELLFVELLFVELLFVELLFVELLFVELLFVELLVVICWLLFPLWGLGGLFMSEKKYVVLNDVESYTKGFHLSNYVWNIVISWDFFAKDTMGKQFVRAIDSISANIAEGFGRFHKKDKIKFYRYSKGSVYESLDWCEKARIRKLLKMEEYDYIHNQLKLLPKELNILIKYTNENLKELLNC